MEKKNLIAALIIAAIVVGIGIYFAAQTASFLNGSERVLGRVTSTEGKTREKGWWVYAQYSVDGREYTHRFHTNKAYLYPVGTSVPMLIDRDSPDIVRSDGFFSLWGVPAALFFIGIIVPLVLILAKRSSRVT